MTILDIQGTNIQVVDEAYERHTRIVRLRNEAEYTFLQLGEELYWFEEKKQYLDLGYNTFEQYLADPEVDISRPTAFKLKGIFETYQLGLKVSPAILLPAGYDKLYTIRPYVDEKNVNEWVAKASSISRSDLRQEILERRNGHFGTPELPTGKYKCIVIDPPWPMGKIDRVERPNQGLTLDYPVMELDEIGALPVSDLAEDDCHIYLWVTQKYLPAGLIFLERWGFDYQCLMTWVKPTGMTPYSWMYNTEHVIFGHRGSLPLMRLGMKLSFEAPIIRHSEKPDVFYERVLDASPGPRLEMFTRKLRDGFIGWGNEIPESIKVKAAGLAVG